MPGYPHADGRLNVTGIVLPATSANPQKTGFEGITKVVAKTGHSTKTGELFEHAPTTADIRQALVGDCFLLAAVASVLAQPRGADYILDMMRDLGDGSVVFRFYSSGAARHIRVEKSVLGPFLHNRGALWVQLLEKAYATFSGNGYQSLQGGNSGTIYSALLGPSSDAIAFAEQGRTNEREMLHRAMTYDSSTPDAIKLRVVNTVFQGSQTAWLAWTAWLRGQSIPRKWVDFISSKMMVRMEHFMNFLEDHKTGLDPGVRMNIEFWVVSNSVLPGKRGTGVYTAAELETYKGIGDALAADKPVMVGTPDAFTTIDGNQLQSSGRGFSSGEAKYKGLVAKHFYAVVRCENRAQLKGLVIRNPWGDSTLGVFSYGRNYKPNSSGTLSATSMKQSEFWIDLSDLSKYFSDVTVGAQI